MMKINLLNYDKASLREWLLALGEKPFRAQQLIKWIHGRCVTDFAEMTDLSKALRQLLAEQAEIKPLQCVFDHTSQDGTRKWLLELEKGNNIETVFIPEKDRGTLCVSSQVGCALNCSFCATATQGFNRNLSVAEIIAQLRHAVVTLAQTPHLQQKVTNVVMMGMGEPLMNYDNVLKAMNLMMDDHAYGLSKYRVTLSTSGVVPNMLKLKRDSEAALAVFLHAPDDDLRNQLVPINRKYPLAELMAVCKNYFPKQGKRAITFEYVMLRGVNDSKQQARKLVKLLAGVRGKVNLIPFNPFSAAQYECSEPVVINQFRDILVQSGIVTTTRKTRGDDIAAACGQLVGDFKDKSTRRAHLQRRLAERQASASQ